MHKAAIRMVIISLILAAMAGCEANDGPPDEPGPVRGSVHGQTTVSVGARL